jgi:hypothetical protein
VSGRQLVLHKLACYRGTVVIDSARKHRVADEDMVHAYLNPLWVVEVEPDMRMHVGFDRTGQMLEVGVVASQDGTPVIVHAMAARAKFMR